MYADLPTDRVILTTAKMYSSKLKRASSRSTVVKLNKFNSLLPQKFSWGQLQITKEGFQQLLGHEHVFSPFLNIVNEFGSKIRDGLSKRHTFYGYSKDSTNCPKKTGSLTDHDFGLGCENICRGTS
jgi:hypothetical protein